MSVLSREYESYLRSPGFRKRREALIILAGSRCQHCDTTRNLRIHHLHYNSLGAERPDDVEVLCPRCHWLADADLRHNGMDIACFQRAERDL